MLKKITKGLFTKDYLEISYLKLSKPKIFKFLIFFAKIGQLFKFLLPGNLKSMLMLLQKNTKQNA